MQDGSVSVDGTDVRKIPTKHLRDMESYVTQETHLFHDSIANNIAIAKPGASREEIMDCLLYTSTDAMYILHLRCSQAVFSHETALFFHDLTDREPLKYTITVRTGYNPSRLQEDGFQVYTIKKDLHETGITTMQTPFGHSVPVYDMERTICDLLRSRKNVEMQVFQDALKQYAKRKDKNLRMLMKYATMFHVENILRPYLEVLL